MTEKNRPLTDSIEHQLNIHFIEPNDSSLSFLNSQLDTISQNLGVETRRPVLPEKGFLSSSLTIDQEKAVILSLGPIYASAAVDLQDKLTTISIQENNERMIYLPKIFQEENVPLSLSMIPFHEACGEWAGKSRIFWTRESVAHRVLKVAKAFEKVGILLHLEDVFRPVGVQEGLFFRRVKTITKDHPEWIENWDKVWNEARSKTAICPWMAGHKSGAALDITLLNTDRNPLPLGNRYPEGGPKVAIYYPYITQEEWSTRQLFALTMEMSGLITYPYENWHASMGDLSAGIAALKEAVSPLNYTAIYGPIKSFNTYTGEIEPYNIEEYRTPFFTKEELLNNDIFPG